MNYVAYTDGSYRQLEGIGEVYAAAAILAPEGSSDWKTFAKVCNDKYVAHRNVAGEIFAAMMVCEHLLKAGDCESLTIYYDYEGVEKWATGAWRANKELPKLYQKYMALNVNPAMKVNFVHVKGHSGNRGNEIVDSMCSEAIRQYAIKNRR